MANQEQSKDGVPGKDAGHGEAQYTGKLGRPAEIRSDRNGPSDPDNRS